MTPRSGRAEAVPYSLSRWTDVPAAKWAWFKGALAQGAMQAIDPRTGVPEWWSLKPEETHSLVFWTKDPETLAREHSLLKLFHVEANITITGWEEVEHGAPSTFVACSAFNSLSKLIGADQMAWRFSPVPLPEPLTRFAKIAELLRGHTNRVYLSFLQPNDKVPETRDADARVRIMHGLAEIASEMGMHVMLCNDDQTLARSGKSHPNLSQGVCVPPRGQGKDRGVPVAEPCGCAVMVDPFTINETCTFGCTYCYAADKSLAEKKRNSTKGLPVIR
jgi:hypothetical protein